VATFSVSLPVQTIQERLGDALFPVLPVTLLILAASSVLSFAHLQRVRRPLVTLAAAAERLRRGDFSTSVPAVRAPEFAELAAQLELARVSLHEHLRSAALAQAREWTLFSALRVPVVVTSPDGRVSRFNQAATDEFGDVARHYGQPIRLLIPFEDRGDLSVELEAAGDGAVWRGQLTTQRGSTVDVSVARTRLEEGQLPAMDVYVVNDVSHYAALGRQREQLLHNVAHELRGPLHVLENALGVLKSELADLTIAESQHLIRTAYRTAAHLRLLMEDLLSAGAIQAGFVRIDTQPLELRPMLEQLRETHAPDVEERGQTLEVCAPETALWVYADEKAISRVLSNLVVNASKYGPVGDQLLISAMHAGDWARIAVRDHGPGIAEENQATIFDRFYRAHRLGEAPGIGLGLAIAKEIVGAHGGQIGVESELGKGTVIWFTLPVSSVRSVPILEGRESQGTTPATSQTPARVVR
jgi:signal transduction histidine kinase